MELPDQDPPLITPDGKGLSASEFIERDREKLLKEATDYRSENGGSRVDALNMIFNKWALDVSQHSQAFFDIYTKMSDDIKPVGRRNTASGKIYPVKIKRGPDDEPDPHWLETQDAKQTDEMERWKGHAQKSEESESDRQNTEEDGK